MRKSSLTALAVGLIAAAGINSASAETYRVGVSVAPYGYTDPATGEPTGYAVEVMEAIAADAGFDVEFTVYLTFGELIPALLAGQVDVIGSSVSITTQRIDMGVAFTGVYARHTDALVVAATDQTPYTSFADFAGKPVGAGGGTIYLNYLNNLQAQTGMFSAVVNVTEAFPNADNFDAYGQAIRTGLIQAYMGTTFGRGYEIRTGRNQDMIHVETYEPVLRSATGIAVRADDTYLLGLIQRSLSKLIANGTVAGLAEEWGVLPP